MCNGVLHGEFITNVGFGDIKVVEIGNMRSVVNWWNVIDSESDVKCAGSLIANHLLTSWQSGFCAMASSTRNSLQVEVLVTLRLLRWEGKEFLNLQFIQMARLGLVTIKDVMLMPQRILMAFHTIRSIFRIPRGCNFVWDKLKGLSSWYEPISYLDGGAYELDYDLNK